MNKLILVSILSLALTAPAAVVAQDEKDEPETFIYATYFYCEASRLDEVDEMLDKVTAPLYDAGVKD